MLAPLLQESVERGGGRGDDDIVHGGPMGMGGGDHRLEIGSHDGEVPLGTDRTQEGGLWRPDAGSWSQLDEGLSESSQSGGEVAERAEPGRGGIEEQLGGGGRRLPDHRAGFGFCRVRSARPVGSVDQLGQQRQTTDAVGQHVVEHHDQGRPSPGDAGHEREAPRRPSRRQSGRDPSGQQVEQRLERVADISRAHKQRVRGASIVVTSPMMRMLGAVGLMGWFMNHQRTITTFLTNLHGPDEQLSFLGVPLVDAVISSGVYGNVSVAFAVLSYAGTLGITITTDVEACPDGPDLHHLLQEELDALIPAKEVRHAPIT